MALVGDVIVSARSMIPDPASTLSASNIFSLSITSTAVASTLPVSSNYAAQVTVFTTWGESLPSIETVGINVDGGHSILVSGTLPPGTTKLRVYFGPNGSGSENQFTEFTSLPATISAPGTSGIPPTSNMAYLPDSNGNFVGVQQIYAWFNEALNLASHITGGILDETGAGTTNGQPIYQLTGQWRKLTNMFYDGYDVYFGREREIFRRNAINSYVGMSVSVTLTPNTIVECFPQPNRTAGTGTLSGGPLSATATSLTYTPGASSFVLPVGLVQVGSEVMAYSTAQPPTGGLSNLIRGLGGTVPAIHQNGETVTELNLRMKGYRMATLLAVGQSANQLMVPPGWDSLIPLYIESRFRQAEHEWKVAAELRKAFEEGMKANYMAFKQLQGPIQIGETRGNDAYGQGLGGGFLVN